MASLWKVLAPVDLTLDSEAPVQYAIDVTNALGAELILLNVVDERWHQRGRRRGWPSNAWGGPGINPDIHRVTVTGTVPESIDRYADYVDADVVLMTTRRYGRWDRFWGRSTTADVMKSSGRPVCVTKALNVDSVRYHCRRVLCVVGLEGRDTAVVQLAQEVATRSGSDLILVHVVPPVDEGLLSYSIDTAARRPLSTQLASEKLLDVAAGVPFPVTRSVMMGSQTRCIALAAREHSADLVVAGRSHLGSRGLYTADIEATLSRLQCPLLAIPIGDRTRHRSHDRERSGVSAVSA
jgi:nucleotide-binding universal stress UspA family protein